MISEKEKHSVLSELALVEGRLKESAGEIERFFALLEDEYISVSAELTERLSKQIERMSSCTWRMRVQRVKLKQVGRVVTD